MFAWPSSYFPLGSPELLIHQMLWGVLYVAKESLWSQILVLIRLEICKFFPLKCNLCLLDLLGVVYRSLFHSTMHLIHWNIQERFSILGPIP